MTVAGFQVRNHKDKRGYRNVPMCIIFDCRKGKRGDDPHGQIMLPCNSP